ncbi:MAG: hypothetical protein GY707_08070 [Desulfobacteraceae bacterium]|nr:hypothetical protein [Desulfobacteraceae bacterium]
MNNIKVSKQTESVIILGIPFIIRFTNNTFLPLNHALKTFIRPNNDLTIKPTTIDFVEKSFIGLNPQQYISQRRESISMEQHGNDYLFSFFTGQFQASKNFKKIKLWSPYENEMSIERDGFLNYSGDPTLRLIAWGRAAIENYSYLHGALVVIEKKYILLMGDSGVGKTTLSNLACECGATCLTEENPFLSWKNNKPYVHSSPWPGIKGPDKPVSNILSAIFFLRHASQNQLTSLGLEEKCRRLLHNTRTFNWLPETIPASIELIDKVAKNVPAFDFGFIPDQSAVHDIIKVL